MNFLKKPVTEQNEKLANDDARVLKQKSRNENNQVQANLMAE